MAIGSLLPAGYETLEDNNGASVPGGLIWTYVAGTSTPQATYTDAGLTVLNTNPIITDGAGRWSAYAPTGVSFKLVFETPAVPPAHGATIRTSDNVSGPVFTGQLQFPATQVPSSDPNVLDDYEEGSWTPVLGGVGGTSGQVYNSQVGSYVKIGRQVTIQFEINLSIKGTITGNVAVLGIPFPASGNGGSGPVAYWASLATSVTHIMALMQGSTALLLGPPAAATSTVIFQTTNISNATAIMGSATHVTTQ